MTFHNFSPSFSLDTGILRLARIAREAIWARNSLVRKNAKSDLIETQNERIALFRGAMETFKDNARKGNFRDPVYIGRKSVR